MPQCQWLGKRCGNTTPGGRDCLECMAAEINYYRHRIRNLMDYGNPTKVETAVKVIPIRRKSYEELSQTLIEHIGEENRLYQKIAQVCRYRKDGCQRHGTCRHCDYLQL